jgi:biopolymer transport protein ExbD
VEIAESNLLTLRINDKGQIYWAVGIDAPEKIEFGELRNFLIKRNQENPKLTTLVKVDRKGKYEMMVDIMDELNVANVSRFSLAPLLDADKAILAKVKG